MISGLHSPCSVGVAPFGFCALRQKIRPLWAESQQEGLICDSQQIQQEAEKRQKTGKIADVRILRVFRVRLQVASFVSRPAEAEVREPPAERLGLVWQSCWGLILLSHPADRCAALLQGPEGELYGSRLHIEQRFDVERVNLSDPAA